MTARPIHAWGRLGADASVEPCETHEWAPRWSPNGYLCVVCGEPGFEVPA